MIGKALPSCGWFVCQRPVWLDLSVKRLVDCHIQMTTAAEKDTAHYFITFCICSHIFDMLCITLADTLVKICDIFFFNRSASQMLWAYIILYWCECSVVRNAMSHKITYIQRIDEAKFTMLWLQCIQRLCAIVLTTHPEVSIVRAHPASINVDREKIGQDQKYVHYNQRPSKYMQIMCVCGRE